MSAPIIERENSSGEVTFKERQVEWHMPNGGSVLVDLNEVVAIGEYTTSSGPFMNDWFLVFVFKTGAWEEVSVYAGGFDELALHLSKVFCIDFSKTFLANSTEWKSFVRFPRDLEGKELFVLTPPKGYRPPTTLLQNIMVALGIGVYGRAWECDLTKEVKAETRKASS